MNQPPLLDPIAARVQALPPGTQALLMASLHDAHQQGRRFAPSDITNLMDRLALPRIHVSNALALLGRSGLIGRTPGRGAVWRITPIGRARVDAVVTPPEALLLAHATSEVQGSILGGQVHSLVPHWLAPPDISSAVQAFVRSHPFERNVFAMTRFPRDGSDDPLRDSLHAAAEAASGQGFELLLASDRNLVDDLWGNVMAHIWASSRGIAIFEDRANLGINLNLSIETGAMLMTGRRCMLLRDSTVRVMPTDFVGHIYHSISLDDPQSIGAAVEVWGS